MRIRRPKKSVLTGAVAALGVCSVVLAFIAPGVEETKVDLNDGGVWVTNAKRGIVAHVNVPARLMDAGLHAASSTFASSKTASRSSSPIRWPTRWLPLTSQRPP